MFFFGDGEFFFDTRVFDKCIGVNREMLKYLKCHLHTYIGLSPFPVRVAKM